MEKNRLLEKLLIHNLPLKTRKLYCFLPPNNQKRSIKHNLFYFSQKLKMSPKIGYDLKKNNSYYKTYFLILTHFLLIKNKFCGLLF